MVDTVEIPLLDERQLARGSPGNGGKGKVAFDDRGNAVWQFAPHTLSDSEEDSSPPRGLDHPGLAIVDEDPIEGTTLRTTNVKGSRVGYNPYNSGQLERKARRKARDMRELSRWIEIRRKLGSASE